MLQNPGKTLKVMLPNRESSGGTWDLLWASPVSPLPPHSRKLLTESHMLCQVSCEQADADTVPGARDGTSSPMSLLLPVACGGPDARLRGAASTAPGALRADTCG